MDKKFNWKASMKEYAGAMVIIAILLFFTGRNILSNTKDLQFNNALSSMVFLLIGWVVVYLVLLGYDYYQWKRVCNLDNKDS